MSLLTGWMVAMFNQPDLRSPWPLGLFLHAVGVLGLAAIASVAFALVGDFQGAAQATADRGSVEPASRLRKIRAELVQLEGQWKAAEARLQEESRRVPPEPRESEFLKDMLQVAKQTGLDLRDYQPATPVTMGGSRQLPIRLSGAADYRAICRFLDGVSRLPRLTTIEKLEISATPPGAPYPVAMTVAVYFTDQATPAGNRGGGKNG